MCCLFCSVALGVVLKQGIVRNIVKYQTCPAEFTLYTNILLRKIVANSLNPIVFFLF